MHGDDRRTSICSTSAIPPYRSGVLHDPSAALQRSYSRSEADQAPAPARAVVQSVFSISPWQQETATAALIDPAEGDNDDALTHVEVRHTTLGLLSSGQLTSCQAWLCVSAICLLMY